MGVFINYKITEDIIKNGGIVAEKVGSPKLNAKAAGGEAMDESFQLESTDLRHEEEGGRKSNYKTHRPEKLKSANFK